MEHALVATAIIGIVEFIKALNAKDWETAEIIFCAVFIGGLCGFFQIEGLTLLTGMQFGFAASGSYKGLSLIGRQQVNETSTKTFTFPTQ